MSLRKRSRADAGLSARMRLACRRSCFFFFLWTRPPPRSPLFPSPPLFRSRERGRHVAGGPDVLEPPHADQAIERVAGQLALDAHARVAAHEDVVTAVGEPLPGDDLAH